MGTPPLPTRGHVPVRFRACRPWARADPAAGLALRRRTGRDPEAMAAVLPVRPEASRRSGTPAGRAEACPRFSALRTAYGPVI